MSFARATGSALLVALTGITTAMTPAANALPGPFAADAQPAVAPVTVPASTAVQDATAHGFYWQLTRAQPVVAGSVLLEGHGARARDSKRAGRSDEQLFAISRTGSNDVPEAALRAYHRAASALAATDPSCRLSWTLLAAIGRVESNHGRFGGAELGSDGVSRPAIVGPRLDGAGPFAAIHDTEGGRIDGDPTWDRAVGQMQFLPSTWRGVARDGDGDGRSDPFDIDDSALGAGVYLCGAGDLSTTAGMARAAYRYNQSDYYVALVLAYARGYETGVFTLPSPPPEPGAGDGHPALRAADPRPHAGRAAKPARQPVPTAATPRIQPSAKPSATPRPAPTRTPTPTAPRPKPTTQAPAPTPTTTNVSFTDTWHASAGSYSIRSYVVDARNVISQALGNLDGDSTTEDTASELDGLDGQMVDVVLQVPAHSTTAVLVTIRPHPGA